MELHTLYLVVCNQRTCEILTLDEQELAHARFQFSTMIREDGSVLVRTDDGHEVALFLGDIATVRTSRHAFTLSLRSTKKAAAATIREFRPDGADLVGETFVVVEDIGVDSHKTEVVRVVLGGENAEFTRYGIVFRRRNNALVARRSNSETVVHVFHRFDKSWEVPTPVPHRVVRVTTKKTRADADLYAACPVIPPE